MLKLSEEKVFKEETASAIKAGILKCPFCGGVPEFAVGDHAFTDITIKCTKCYITSPLFDYENEGNSVQLSDCEMLRFNIRSATKYWNTRIN